LAWICQGQYSPQLRIIIFFKILRVLQWYTFSSKLNIYNIVKVEFNLNTYPWLYVFFSYLFPVILFLGYFFCSQYIVMQSMNSLQVISLERAKVKEKQFNFIGLGLWLSKCDAVNEFIACHQLWKDQKWRREAIQFPWVGIVVIKMWCS